MIIVHIFFLVKDMDINDYKSKKKKSNKDNNNFKKFVNNYFFNFVSRFLICVVLSLLCLIVVKVNSTYKTYIHKYVYENNFSFSFFTNLYNKYLGGVFPLDNIFSTDKVFNEKLSYKNDSKYKDGCKLEVDNNYLIPSIDSGIIVYIGDKDDYGKVVIVQQNNGVDVWYGNVDTNLNMYDYIERGELIGQSRDKYIYLVFEKEGKYLDYKEFI